MAREAVGIAIGKWAGFLVAAILAWVFLTATVVYNYAFARLLFVSGLEKRLPHQMGRVNRNKVPAVAVVVQSIIGAIIGALVFFVFGGGPSDPYRYFYALYAGLTIVWCISTALLFLDIFFAKRANPEVFERERRAPMWVLYTERHRGNHREHRGRVLHLRGVVVSEVRRTTPRDGR